MIEDITMDTIVFVGQVVNPLSQGLSVVSIPIVNTPTQTPTQTPTPIKCKFIILNHKNNKLQLFYF
jgi:hypothetical protein